MCADIFKPLCDFKHNDFKSFVKMFSGFEFGRHIYEIKQTDLGVQTAEKNLNVLCIEPLTSNAGKIASNYEQRHTSHCFGEYLPIVNHKLGVNFFKILKVFKLLIFALA